LVVTLMGWLWTRLELRTEPRARERDDAGKNDS
jgi:hypothetical protein